VPRQDGLPGRFTIGDCVHCETILGEGAGDAFPDASIIFGHEDALWVGWFVGGWDW
jgi:hypothetical protein